MTSGAVKASPEVSLDHARARIEEALRGLRFGSVEIQVHDSHIVRITRTERVRVDNGKEESRKGGDDG